MIMGTLSASLSLSGSLGDTRLSYAKSNAGYLTGEAALVNSQVVTTSESALEIPAGITDVGLVCLVNKDTANPVLVGVSGSFPLVIAPNDGFCFIEVAPSEVIYLKALSGSAEVQLLVVESGGYPDAVTTTTTTTTT
jgi:hypothetical protein